MEAFAPGLVDDSWESNPSPVEVAVCKHSAGGIREFAGFGDASHFMAAVPNSKPNQVAGSSAVAEGMRRGFTVLDGDCGPDALCIVETGTPRT